MSALSLANQRFSTFHSNTAAIPAEITSQIIGYAIADTQLLPMGGGVGMRRAHHPVASISGEEETFRWGNSYNLIWQILYVHCPGILSYVFNVNANQFVCDRRMVIGKFK